MLIPITPHSKHLKSFQRKLRRNPTPAEEYITELLHECKIPFRRQQCFADMWLTMYTGTFYIADFWLRGHKVIIECDGWQHYIGEGLKQDKVRDKHFRDAGIRTIRLKNKVAFGLTKRRLLSLIGN